jgi:uncharacterized RDD family membrane protein YckC
LSTLSSHARLSPNWKEEVNQRIAAHKNRKSSIAGEQGIAPPENHVTNNRASAAAARVAARFAKAPSYGDLLENEARAAVRAAEAASRAALQAQAVAESVLAELQAAKAAQPEWQFEQDEEPAAPQFQAPIQDFQTNHFEQQAEAAEPFEQNYEVRWETDAPTMPSPALHVDAPAPACSEHTSIREFEPQQDDGVRIVEPDKPIHANLIQFPREIVATRKARPRRVEGPLADQQHEVQLSIFEVEPETISTEPTASEAMSPTAAPTWMEPEWSGLELGEHPVPAMDEYARWEQIEEPAAEPYVYRGIPQAPWDLKIMAALVDGSLVVGAFVLFTLEIVSHMHNLPAKHPAELIGAFGILFTSALYIALFSALGWATPGMRYARIALCSFDGDLPTRKMRFQRLAALGLSVLPLGMGLLWSLFDEDHLSWHDRLSGTYLRAY